MKIPWNKGKKGLQVAWNKGLKIKESHMFGKSAAEGYKWTDGQKENLKEARKLQFEKYGNPGFKKGVPSWNKGISYHAMENHPNWQGGISFEPYGKEFNETLKEQIRQRDNHQCQECGWFQMALGYKLPVHHKDFNKKNNDPQNLTSLCRGCHGQIN